MVKMHLGARLFAGVAALSLLAAACGGDDDDDATDTTAAEAESEGEEEGALAGMKGTQPLPAELGQDFTDRLMANDPGLTDLNYAPESYDAVMIIVLAAQIAGTDGSELAAEINGITRDGEKCTTYADCLALIQAGTDIDYDGVSGPGEFTGNGEPSQGTYAIFEFGADNRLLEDRGERGGRALARGRGRARRPGRCAARRRRRPEARQPPAGHRQPGVPRPAGVSPASKLALEEVNAAGGFNGQPVQYSEGDSGDTSTDLASQTVDRLLSENVDAIVGAASSGVTLTVIDKITAAGVIQFSPANTSAALTSYPDKGLYFRTAPPDVLQGEVLAGVVAEDGNQTIVIMNLDDAYGNGLAESVAASFEAAGGEVLESIVYDPQAQTFDAEVQTAADADPDGVVLIGFDESSRILTAMVEAGIGPQDINVYGCDGNMGNALGENFDAGE